jgi:cysteinyl-tRNA synthetase
MSLHIYNSLNRQKELFKPITPNTVKMYVCGMTVYDYCHIGHARVMVVFDIIAKWLRNSGFDVTYVRNITDIDDKIIDRAVKNKESISSLTERFINAMYEDADALGVTRPDFEPKATEYVKPMLEMIGKLFSNNLAYQSESGDVNFKVRSFPNYGKLSGKNIEDLQSGHREVANLNTNNSDSKKDPLDFVLWKAAKENEPQEVKWQSSWGEGRPGWHIECSAMSCSILGQQFDIHGGGMDLQFPHHENEIAQSEGANNYENGEYKHQNVANYWIHNGFVKVNDEKMSKSLGNFFTIREVFEHFHPEVVRFFILKAHYRSPLNYADTFLQEAKIGLERIYNCLEKYDNINVNENDLDWQNEYANRFKEALDDDFNTAIAISVLFEMVSEINKHNDLVLVRLLKNLANILGFGQLANSQSLNINKNDIDEEFVLQKINERINAKTEKRYKDADNIRNSLLEMGIVLQDKPNGETTWKKS